MPARFTILILLILTACGSGGAARLIAPFPDRPDELYAFEYVTKRVSGVVWSYQANGKPVIYGGPLGLVYKNRLEPAIKISGTGIEILTASDATNQDAETMVDLINAAREYCAAYGLYDPEQSGTNVFSHRDELYLIRFCLPKS